MGGNSSSEAPRTGVDEKFQERVAQIIAEESRKQNESRAVQAARDARIKDLMRDVLKEADTRKSSSSVDESAARNTITNILTELLASRRNDPDKSNMINLLLDIQQRAGGSANSSGGDNAFLTKFIEKELQTLQSTQDVKITVEKKSSAASSRPQPAELPWEAPSTKSTARANTPTSESLAAPPKVLQHPLANAKVSPQKLPAYSEGPSRHQELFYEETHFQNATQQGNATSQNTGTFQNNGNRTPPPSYMDSMPIKDPLRQNFPNPPPTFKDNRPFQDPFKEGKPYQQNFPNPPPVLKGHTPYQIPQPSYQNVPPPPNYGQIPNKVRSSTNKNNPFPDKPFQEKTPFKDNPHPQDARYQVQNNAPFKNNKPGNDNGPFLDKGPFLHDKDGGPDGNSYRKVPPPLLDAFPNRGKFVNNRPNRPHHRGRPPGQSYGPDPRRSESPHHTQNRYQNRNDERPYTPPCDEGGFQGPNYENARNPNHQFSENHRGDFHQYRGRGPRRPFPPRGQGNYPRGHSQHFQNPGPGGRDDLYPGMEPPYYAHGQHHDSRFDQSGRGNHQARPSRPVRGNNSNANPRSFSQPRARNVHQSQESLNDQEKPGDQTTGNKQGNKATRGQYKGQGALPKGKPNAGGPKPKNQQKQREGAWAVDSQNDADDSDGESAKSGVSTKTNWKFDFKEGVYIVREDGTIFTTIEAMGDLGAVTVPTGEKKKKKNKSKNRAKKASSATDLSVPQNDATELEDSQSDGKEGLVSSTEGKEEASSPLKLFLGGLDDKALEKFAPDEILSHSIVLIAKVEDSVKSYHPTTVGELVALKKKHPNAEVIVVS